MVQVYTDKTVTALKANAAVTYPVHVVLSNSTKRAGLFLVSYRYTCTWLLTECTKDDEQDQQEKKIESRLGIELSIDSLFETFPFGMENDFRNMKLEVQHGAMQTVLQLSIDFEGAESLVNVCWRKFKLHRTSTL